MNTQPKFDLYQSVTDRIIAALEAGTAPWLKPWQSPECRLALPRNAVSNRFYSGINILLLWLAAEEHGYKQSKWITVKAANELGGHIRKGEKSTLVVKYKPIEREKLDENDNTIFDGDGNPEMERFAFLKTHHLFNIEQCENLPAYLYDDVESPVADTGTQYREFAEIRQIIEGINLQVETRASDRAFYRPKTDVVVMPEMKKFNSETDFYSTLLHFVKLHRIIAARKSFTISSRCRP